jgi:hypothetical protein
VLAWVAGSTGSKPGRRLLLLDSNMVATNKSGKLFAFTAQFFEEKKNTN